jgi:glycosyltransferase involved in cell wall biosynthesis
MSEMVCYIPSFNDSDLVRQSLATLDDWDVVISDNASDEPHRVALAALASDRVRVVRQPTPLGRVGNWKACVEHFRASGRSWMKFLCAGDRHKPGSQAMFLRGIERFPQARFLVGRIENVWPQGSTYWALTEDYRLVPPADSLRACAMYGNVFHGLIAGAIHADALGGGFGFGEDTLSYCADMMFLAHIARHNDTLYVPEIVAEFIVANRKNFSAGHESIGHLVEESLVRLRAAEWQFELTRDEPTREQLKQQVMAYLREGLQRLRAD